MSKKSISASEQVDHNIEKEAEEILDELIISGKANNIETAVKESALVNIAILHGSDVADAFEKLIEKEQTLEKRAFLTVKAALVSGYNREEIMSVVNDEEPTKKSPSDQLRELTVENMLVSPSEGTYVNVMKINVKESSSMAGILVKAVSSLSDFEWEDVEEIEYLAQKAQSVADNTNSDRDFVYEGFKISRSEIFFTVITPFVKKITAQDIIDLIDNVQKDKEPAEFNEVFF